MAAYEASVSVRVSARHAVRAPDGTMEAPHAHAWRVTAVFGAGQLDDHGFVIDFVLARKALADIGEALAGSNLNDLPSMPPGGATAERLAEYLAGQMQRRLGRPATGVRVAEAPGCQAAFYPAGLSP